MKRLGRFGLMLAVFSALPWLMMGGEVVAQIVPDGTLGPESSVVVPEDALTERIEQGAIRGDALFHSFQEFNIGEGRSAYFANPVGIRNILSRVTGSDLSDIFGTLGVDGDANLFFLNPNGIVFGTNARLDVAGSFVGSTSDRFTFTDGSSFNAIAPNLPPLLSVNLTPGLQLGAGRSPITNDGQLIAGQDLTLNGSMLDLEGQLVSGRDLLLEGDRVQIRDNALVPFIAQAGGTLVVEANTVDISALNHPGSRLVSGGNMVLRSGSPVIGDARYWSGGTFRIETANQELGFLSSIDDPVIRAAGDVELAGYEGASLHILAGGRVTIPGPIVITGTDLDNGLVETFSLSDGSTMEIDGQANPTLDIRAGTMAIAPPEVIGDVPNLTLSNPATDSGIIIGGTITNLGGTVFLTNQYQPNLVLSGGDINVGRIDAVTSDVVIDARGRVNVTDNITTSTFGADDAGDIRILAESLQVTNQSFLSTATSGSGQAGNITIQTSDSVVFDEQSGAISQVNFDGTNNAGDIAITTRVLDVLNSSTLSASTFGDGNAGDVVIRADEGVRIAGNSSLRTAVDKDENNPASMPGNGEAGSITIETNSLFVEDQSELRARTFGVGNAGIININASGQVIFDAQGVCPSDKACGAVTQVDTDAQGNAGGITINANSLMVQNGSVLASGSFGQGDGGRIEVNANDVFVQDGSRLLTALEANASGNSGDIEITANRLEVTGNGAALVTSSLGNGNAGNILIRESGVVVFDGELGGCLDEGSQCGAISQVDINGQGNAGNINITANSLSVENGATLTTSNFSNSMVPGNAGNITIDAGTISVANRSRLSTTLTSGTVGNSGDISVTTDSLSVTGDGAVFLTSTAGEGDAGNIQIKAIGSVIFDGASGDCLAEGSQCGAISQVDMSGQGNAGNIAIDARSLAVENGATLITSNLGTSTIPGEAGNITIDVDETITVANRSRLSTMLGLDATGSSGDINISTDSLSVSGDGAALMTNTAGTGDAGNIQIDASGSVVFDGELGNCIAESSQCGAISQVDIDGQGNAGNINIAADSLSVENGATLTTSNLSDSTTPGESGNITINSDAISVANRSRLSTRLGRQATGRSGDITITTDSLAVTGEGTALLTNTRGRGDAGRIRIDSSGDVVFDGNPDGVFDPNARDGCFAEGAQCGAISQVNHRGIGNAGDIEIRAASFRLQNGTTLTTSNFSQRRNRPQDVGTIDINANTINLANRATLRSTIERKAISRRAGEILLNADHLTVSGGTSLTASTLGVGDTGSIAINASDRVIFDNSSATVRVEEGATADESGGITITTGSLDVINGAALEVNSFSDGDGGDITIIADETVRFDDGGTANSRVNTLGTGTGGDINIQSDLLLLFDDAQLLADTVGLGTAGNINVSEQQIVLLRNDSSIETDADSDNSGGNIDIDSDFVFALLPENSDIIANAQEGPGGNITITTQFISGFRITDTLSRFTSDISASSEFGLDGTVLIDDLGLDPVQAVAELPVDTAAPELSQGCQPGIDGRGKFINTEHGGIPPNPSGSLDSGVGWEDVEPALLDEAGRDHGIEREDQSTSPNPIMEAEGFQVDQHGQVVLLHHAASQSIVFACQEQSGGPER